MKQIWAPWRLDYILGGKDPSAEECIFCVSDRLEDDRRRLILYRGEESFVMMNKYPYTNGHLMVVPYRHTADLGGLNDAEALEMHRLLALCQAVLQERIAPEGFNVGMNLGRVAGAGILDHLHVHLVPRWNGDTNFMPVFADVRVIPQHLEATYDHLAAGFSERRL